SLYVGFIRSCSFKGKASLKLIAWNNFTCSIALLHQSPHISVSVTPVTSHQCKCHTSHLTSVGYPSKTDISLAAKSSMSSEGNASDRLSCGFVGMAAKDKMALYRQG
ncbi:hypothetical protein STEG23_027150, partial [Scotinomys teguina]